MKPKQLKPCPFCGERPVLKMHNQVCGELYHACSVNRHMRINLLSSNVVEHVNEWNTRKENQ